MQRGEVLKRLRTTRERRRYTLPAHGIGGLPVIAMRRVTAAIFGRLRDLAARRIDRTQSSYLRETGAFVTLKTFLLGIEAASSDSAAATAIHYFCQHRFDLLGSGWTRVFHGMECRGLEDIRFAPGEKMSADTPGHWLKQRVTQANLAESQRIWKLVDSGYTPIDWHIDFKSGFRWPELTWSRDIRIGKTRGADIKVPWELSRLQHLPQIAIEYGITRSQPLCAEIRNQMLDWIASNPPRFGVNWVSTMDVAIRVANMVIAYDLAIAYGAAFDAEFNRVIRRSILEHAHHIVDNLEWSADFRGNHYLSNVAGLLFAAGYLDEAANRESWIRFATKELITAVEEQFLDDGANFEASSSYHRLSAEMAVYSTALARRLRLSDADPFPDWYYKRLEGMGEFSLWMTGTDGNVVQIGDNDSGRFLKLRPRRDLVSCSDAVVKYRSLDGYTELSPVDPFPDEQHLDHRHLLAGLSPIIDRKDFIEASESNAFEREFVSFLAGASPPRQSCGELLRTEVRTRHKPITGKADAEAVIDIGDNFQSVAMRAFPEFGAFILRSERAHLCIRCGPIGQNGIGGHAHNDQLSFSLSIDGHIWSADPGTYLYTPMPERRNSYRSAKAHNGPRPESGEPGYLGVGLFRIIDSWRSECLEFSPHTFLGVMHRRSSRIFRRIAIHGNHLIVEDWARGCKLAQQGSRIVLTAGIPFSPGYGLQYRIAPPGTHRPPMPGGASK